MIVVTNTSSDIYRDIFSKTELTCKSKLLLLYILLRDEREFRFSATRVAMRMGCSKDKVKAAMKELEDKGLLTKECKTPNILRYTYFLTFPR